MNKENLQGGNVSTVYRVKDTVHRKIKENSEKMHAVLKYLEKKNFSFSPRYIGEKDGYEILTFLEGEAGNEPIKEYMWLDDNLIFIAKMLREYHDVMLDYPNSNDWRPLDNTPKPYEVLCHNDFSLYNIIFANQKPVGIIDFDVLGVGPRVWDIAYTVYTCVPLSSYHIAEDGKKRGYQKKRDSEIRKKRVLLFLEAYGYDGNENILDIVIQRLHGLCQTIERKAQEGETAFQKMLLEGHVKHYQKEIIFIETHRKEWE